MSCFNVWIVPKASFEEDAAKIGNEFGIPLRSTFAYDEYPAFEFELNDETGSFVRLLGPPNNVDELIKNYPSEFGIKDKNYWLTICAHAGLPMPEGIRKKLPGADPFEFARNITMRLKSLGYSLFKLEPPYTTTGSGKLVHHDLFNE